ncbi:MAG TPA: AmmeMemoRadiSam system radical SAM enzyme [Spirochaetota bacterium]|nr:AmmeMemoRadiSam system radical SAM enzyme [Spirochaetota bacterium]HOL56988.1 AmmeMemoRadiSam system radical SAM enzyme [Spirochaetota bacterium]HPP05528.1 AmmeMemoRadiSam system radical SAM enzyme [Spirochaetota bacterium]
MEVRLYQKINDKTECLLCPNNCKLKEGQSGLCNIRENVNGNIINPYSGIISSSGIDPIEKKPLYHFYPGSEIYSIGFFGCTLKCQFCQNWQISQNKPLDYFKKISPEDFVLYLKKNNFNKIAYTYSEPTLYYEWVLETAKLCRKNDIKNVIVTNGYLNKEPAKELLKFIDAANIDLKGADDQFYKKNCNGKIEPVKEFIKIAFDLNVHIELTTLVITNTNDSMEDCKKIMDFIKSISTDIPFHISRYHSAYKFNLPPTQEKTIKDWVNYAKNHLNFVYGGNVLFDNDTYCHNCKSLLIKRNFYLVSLIGIDNKGICLKCSSKNNIIM